MEIGEHLFRHESGRMVAALTRIFGLHNLTLAEDCVQDAFCKAFDIWKIRGVPPNPTAWLMTTAKHRALDVLRRERTARTYAPELGRMLESEWTRIPAMEEQFTPNAIRDDLLRMMFSCCQPQLPEVAQVSLMLQILCGFSVAEIASAFVSKPAAIEKRITRAKKVLSTSKKLFAVTEANEFGGRQPVVHRALYLLFNEGYHSASPDASVRTELCQEAMRLTAVLLEHPLGRTPTTYALAALMAFNAARLPTRVDASGNLSTLFDQNRQLWDKQLTEEAWRFMELSATGSEYSEYHIEAAIASLHARAPSAMDTDWAAVVSLYDALLASHPSPIVELNRAIAVAQLEGPRRGLDELATISDIGRLAEYPFFFAALGELELRLGQKTKAAAHFREALAQARNPMERRFLSQRINDC
jgi:RNA polymerase sigma factor (sigma-70 family)